MKEKLGQESAFPEPFLNDPHLSLSCEKGMNKRFYAACAAMRGILASGIKIDGSNPRPCNTAYAAYNFADELLRQENEN